MWDADKSSLLHQDLWGRCLLQLRSQPLAAVTLPAFTQNMILLETERSPFEHNTFEPANCGQRQHKQHAF